VKFPRYQYRLPDGQRLETGDLRRLKQEHPDATIVARVDLNELGYADLKPYRGEQPEAAAQDAIPGAVREISASEGVEIVTESNVPSEPAKRERKRG
jgi:hypothetical protein